MHDFSLRLKWHGFRTFHEGINCLQKLKY